MIDKDLNLVSAALRSNARVHSGGEVFWPMSCIEQVLRELADKNRAILGFDIATLDSTADGWAPCIVAESTYDIGSAAGARPWGESVALSLQLALRDLEQTRGQARSSTDDDAWYSVVAIDEQWWGELLRTHPRNKNGLFEVGRIQPRTRSNADED